MSIDQDVNDQLKEAMRARDKMRTMALRNIRAALIEKRKEDGADAVGDDAARAVLRRMAKQRRESIAAYSDAGRDDLVEQERAELDVVEGFLPRLADEGTVRGWVSRAIEQVGASGPSDMGKVMGVLMKLHRDDFDGKLANRLVREALNDAG